MTLSRRIRVATAATAVATLALGGVTAGASADAVKTAGKETFDYVSNRGLSQPTAGEIRKDTLLLPMRDGVKIYLEITRPKAEGQYPVVLESSPYHGTIADRDGTRILPHPQVNGKSIGLTGFFPKRGYAVVMMDLRGTGKSSGCLDHLGPNDARDLKAVVEWAASQPWSNGRVGMTGHSYVGSTPSVAAAQKPKGLETIVPSAGLASMYDHQFQGGVPYLAQYAGPMSIYAALSVNRHLPPGVVPSNAVVGPSGDNFGNDMQDFGCGMKSVALTAGSGQVTGQYENWHHLRDWSQGATEADIPVFLVHGVNDNAARIPAANWFFDRNGRDGDKAWIGQWDHGSSFAPTRRGMHWTYALLAWFDKHLKERNVDTGPAVEVFMNNADTLPGGIADAGDREVLNLDGYPTKASPMTLFTDASGKLVGNPAADGASTFSGDARNTGLDALGNTAQTTGAFFTSAPFEKDVVLAGMPSMNLDASVTVPQVHLIGTLYDKSPNGKLRRITTFAINPLLRGGVEKITPLTPGARLEDMQPPAFAMGHHVAAGHSLVLRVATSDGDKVPTATVDPQVKVFSGGAKGTSITLPVVEKPVLTVDELDTKTVVEQ